MTARTDLMQHGKALQMKVVQRQSRGGVFGGMSGTCSIMERLAVAMGKDVAHWPSTTATTPLPQLPPSSGESMVDEGGEAVPGEPGADSM